MLNKADSGLARLNMNVVIHAIDHLRHLARKRHTICLQYQFRTIDVERLVLPGALTAVEGLLHRAKKGTVRCLNRILTCFIDLKDGSTGLEHAEMVTLDRKQRTINDIVVGVVPEQDLRSHNLLAVVGEG